MANIDWQKRAIERRKELKRISKKVKELTISRDTWKEKALLRKKESDELKKQISHIKKNIQKTIKM